jgi:hypothetical protein
MNRDKFVLSVAQRLFTVYGNHAGILAASCVELSMRGRLLLMEAFWLDILRAIDAVDDGHFIRLQ